MNYNEMELEQLRSELSDFKKRLDKQQIVNDQLMRQSMKSKMSWIRRVLWLQVAAIPLVAIMIGSLMHDMHLSWWWFAYTIVMLVVDVSVDFYINHMHADEFTSGNLVDTARHLVEMKESRKKGLALGLVMLAVWLGWLAFMLWQLIHDPAADVFDQGRGWGMLFGSVVGLAIGLPVGLSIYFKMQRINTEIIRQIDDLLKEE